MKKIYVAIPSGTGFPYPDVILNICKQEIPEWWELVFYKENIIANRPIHIARNILVWQFLKSWCDYIWFCDDDNPPSIDVLKYLIEWLEKWEDVVSALVPLRHWGYTLNVTINNEWLKSLEWYDGLFEIENFGTWCVVLSRQIIQDVCDITGWKPYQFIEEAFVFNEITKEKEKYIHQDYIPWWQNTYKKYWFNIAIEYMSISEDLHFWHIAKDLWYRFYAHSYARCRHYKNNNEFISVKNC